ncbi:hypothetical protein K466DRAFT_599515 [Polyporus arcularius HHB13444]|uniref:Uncharacterized protein n=1 Tax=Polyporus arcularius HHB13444 TaxID=1314778 RepID=A0A5C3PEQ9_9APHY|nr:hypothetical protein K466DRAFT_599515 [Polyporus arcularius HHB13444]
MNEPWNTYQKHLEVLGHGLPLWDPAPKVVQRSLAVTDAMVAEGSSSPPIEIIPGSVLYPIPFGGFGILFNAMKRGDEHAWQPRGVPDHFQTLQEFTGMRRQLSSPSPVEDLKGFTYSNVAVKTKIPIGGDVSVSAARAPILDLPVQGGSGAFLVTVDTPIYVSFQSQLSVESYMLEYHAQWMRMGFLKYGLPIKNEDLYLVIGTIKTTHWLVGSHRKPFSHLPLDATFATHEGRNSSFHHGPQCASSPGDNNQCIFVHYAKLKRRPPRTGVKRLWHSARLYFRGQNSKAIEYADPMSELPLWQRRAEREQLGPLSQPAPDPVDVLLDYILHEQPDADIAIASSLQIVALFKASLHHPIHSALEVGTGGLEAAH